MVVREARLCLVTQGGKIEVYPPPIRPPHYLALLRKVWASSGNMLASVITCR